MKNRHGITDSDLACHMCYKNNWAAYFVFIFFFVSLYISRQRSNVYTHFFFLLSCHWFNSQVFFFFLIQMNFFPSAFNNHMLKSPILSHLPLWIVLPTFFFHLFTCCFFFAYDDALLFERIYRIIAAVCSSTLTATGISFFLSLHRLRICLFTSTIFFSAVLVLSGLVGKKIQASGQWCVTI